jgi:Family of unknown function (DUF5995)
LGANLVGGSRPARVAGAVSLALALAIAAAPPAPAENLDGTPNWPEVLPPRPDVSGRKVEVGFDVCPRGRLRCPRRVVAEMTERWAPLDAECDHRAVFALTYLRTTEEYLRTVSSEPHFFSRPGWVNREDAVFAELYFRAYDRYVEGRPVPEAWRIVFEANGSPNVTGLGDMLLGMSAHINRDLPYALAHVGLRKRDGRSRKPDHDRVNAFLERVVDPLQRELGERYDPIFGISDAEPVPIDEAGALSVVRAWRENAWRNAERLVLARDDPARLDAVRRSIELQAAAAAQALRAVNTVPGYASIRNRYCRAGAPPPSRDVPAPPPLDAIPPG